MCTIRRIIALIFCEKREGYAGEEREKEEGGRGWRGNFPHRYIPPICHGAHSEELHFMSLIVTCERDVSVT